jgi:nicotinamide mononucleotide transporter
MFVLKLYFCRVLNICLMLVNIFSDFYYNLLQTTYLEFIAVLFGLLSVWYVRKEDILGYPTGLVNVGCYIYICLTSGLYANMVINIIYFLMSIYGWWKWSRHGNNDEVLTVTALGKKQMVIYLGVIGILFVSVYFVLHMFRESNFPLYDALTTAIFIVAMWLQARKNLESWILWIAGDLIAVPLFISVGLVFTGFQYFVFLALAVSGYINWRKSYIKTRPE